MAKSNQLDIDRLLAETEEAMRSIADPVQAERMASYMKHFVYLGIPSPARNEIQKELFKEIRKPDLRDIEQMVQRCWEFEEREFQYLGMDLWKRFVKKPRKESLPLIESWISNKSWWDTVDALAVHFAGRYFKTHPEGRAERADYWASHSDMWLRRTALLYQLGYKEETDWELLCRHMKSMAQEQEFFIRKAIGWALRQYSKVDPDAVREFIAETELSGLSVREGSKYL